MPGRSELWGFGGHFGAPMSGDGIDRREQWPLRLDHLGRVQAQVLAVARGDDLHAQRQAAGDAGGHRDRGEAEQVDGDEQALGARDLGVPLGAGRVEADLERRLGRHGPDDEGTAASVKSSERLMSAPPYLRM